jgi:hypothetical protein
MRTSAFKISKYRSREAGPILSTSGPLLSAFHTLTRLPVTYFHRRQGEEGYAVFMFYLPCA